MNLFFKLSVLIIAILNYVQTAHFNSENYRIKSDLSTYFNSVIEKVNSKFDPCEDFEKYACGNLEEKTELFLIYRPVTLINSLFIKNEPQNEAERKVRDMHLSCVNTFNRTKANHFEMVKELLAQVRDINFAVNENDVTDKDIPKMFVKIQLLDRESPLGFDVEKKQLKIDTISTIRNTENLEAVLSAAEHIKAKDKITELIDKFKKLNLNQYNSKQAINISVDKLKDVIPSKNIDLTDCYNALRDEFQLDSTNISISNIEEVKEVIKVFDSTDKATILNYLTFKYINTFLTINCLHFDFYYRYAVLSRFWKNNFDGEVTVNRLLNFLDSFEFFFKKLNNEQRLRFAQHYFDKINTKRNIAKNFKVILPDKKRDEFYEKFDIDVNNYYLNAINVFSLLSHIISNLDYDGDQIRNTSEFSTLFSGFDDTIETPIKNKPLIYLYSVLSNELWQDIFDYNSDYIAPEYELAKKCFNETKIDYYYSDAIQFRFQRLAFSIMKHVSSDSNTKLYEEKKLIEAEDEYKEINDINRLYFIALAQYKCKEDKNKLKDFTFKTLRYLDEFSESFNCPLNSKMNSNNVCKVKKCNEEIQNRDRTNLILPSQYKKCDEKLLF